MTSDFRHVLAEASGPTIAVAPGRQPLWRYLLATQSEDEALRECTLLTWPEAEPLIAAFRRNEVDALGMIGTGFLRLEERRSQSYTLFQPITWMAHGPVLVSTAADQIETLDQSAGRTIASPPLDSTLMLYWRALIHYNHQVQLQDLFKITTTPNPLALLERGEVDGAFLDASSWFQVQHDSYHLVTALCTEWKRAIGSDRVPIMGGLVSRQEWTEANTVLSDALFKRLVEGLRLYRTDKAAFIRRICFSEELPSNAAMTSAEADFWCRYWGMDQLSEARLSTSSHDREELAALEAVMVAAGILPRDVVDAAVNGR